MRRTSILAALFGLLVSADNHASSQWVIQPLHDGQAMQPPTLYPLADDQAQHDIYFDKGRYQIHLADAQTCAYAWGASEGQRVRFNQALPMIACATGPFELRVRVAGNIRLDYDRGQRSLTLSLLPKKSPSPVFRRALPQITCADWSGEPVRVPVGSVFAEGEWVTDFYSGLSAQVSGGHIRLTPARGSNGLLLLEAADFQASAFNWDNATVYFLVTDRFANGDTTNDHSFGRQADGQDEIGTFHGGDIKGIIARLDYIQSLGANALWMTPLVEQVHGFVAGGQAGTFPFYAYHGYWALDYTKLDPNFGTDEDLRTLVTQAHRRGIRLIWDAVINHTGYATLQDLSDFQVPVLRQSTGRPLDNHWQPVAGESWHNYHDLIDYSSPNWATHWWGPDWVRGTLPGYQAPGADDQTLALAGLPDFITESSQSVGLPPLLAAKADSRADPGTKTVAEHLIDWQVYWVREFGIDAFRSDTAKHVELERWQQLKSAAESALQDWRGEQPTAQGIDSPFWMVGEVFDHPLYKDYYYDFGFDSLINFEFQDQAHDLAMCMTDMEGLYQRYATEINNDSGFNGLSYISSHDTTLFYAKYQDLDLQRRIAAPFLLLPGGVQLYYGDESARPLGSYGDDFHQGTRSDMNWLTLDPERQSLLAHWRKIGQFRNRHSAIGAGHHQQISREPYVFSRKLGDDRALIVFAGNEISIKPAQ